MTFDAELLEAHALRGSTLLLALSGGADSSAALVLLDGWCREAGVTLAAAHLDHAIRDESGEDAAFCAALCARFGVKLYSRRVDVPSLAAAEGKGVEEAARDARYAFFAEVMAAEGIGVLVTAHHADDNLETILMRLVRGSGLRGLCGIPPMRECAGGVLIRPFLHMTKAELEAVCTTAGISWRTDVTNADTAYTRNRIRAEVIPALAALEPTILRRAADTADALRADAAYLDDAAQRLYAACPTPDCVDLSRLRTAPAALRWRLYARLTAAVGGGMLEQVHLRALDRLLKKENGSLSLPGGVTVLAWGDKLRFLSGPLPAVPPIGWYAPAEDGRQRLDICRAQVGIFENEAEIENFVAENQNIYKLFINRNLNFDTIEGHLHWRTRLPGDTLLLRGHHHSVKKLLQEIHLPPEDRARLPLLCDNFGIVWLPGVGLRDGADHGDGLLAVALEKERIVP